MSCFPVVWSRTGIPSPSSRFVVDSRELRPLIRTSRPSPSRCPSPGTRSSRWSRRSCGCTYTEFAVSGVKVHADDRNRGGGCRRKTRAAACRGTTWCRCWCRASETETAAGRRSKTTPGKLERKSRRRLLGTRSGNEFMNKFKNKCIIKF